MNGNNILIDTNIALYLFNGDKEVEDILYNKHIYLSFISELELLGYPGLNEDSKKIINDFIDDCILIDINQEIKNNSISIRKGHKLKLPDSIIAATCKFLDVPLLTADNDFEKLEELPILLYEI